jgi:hypothetical protein
MMAGPSAHRDSGTRGTDRCHADGDPRDPGGLPGLPAQAAGSSPRRGPPRHPAPEPPGGDRRLGPGEQSLPVPDRGQERPDAPDGRPGRADRPDLGAGADQRRKRDGQGADLAADPPQEPPGPGTVRTGQLRRAERHLLESELFGHEKGAFTGAYAQRKGRFEMAHGGTLLLDEITETPPTFQAKLLRIIEQQEFERVGGNENVRVNVRLISTTNRDLLHEVQMGRFRAGSVLPAQCRPPGGGPAAGAAGRPARVGLALRESLRPGGPAPHRAIDPAMMEILAKYHWPGNVRQLRNVVLTSLILGAGPVLSLADVSWLFDELQPVTVGNVTCGNVTPARRAKDAGPPAFAGLTRHTAGPAGSAASRWMKSSGRPFSKRCARPPATRPGPPRSWASATARCGRRSAAIEGRNAWSRCRMEDGQCPGAMA